MKSAGWLQWGKWAFVGLSVLAIVMTAVNDNGQDTATSPQLQPAHVASAAPARARNAAQQRAPDESGVKLMRLERIMPAHNDTEIGNLFGATSWYVPPPPPPPPPPVKPLPPPPPTAPPMPFTYLGLYEEGKGKVVMLTKGDRVYTVAVGDVIENTYRVERVERSMVEMIYLPLNIKQSISTGNSS